MTNSCHRPKTLIAMHEVRRLLWERLNVTKALDSLRSHDEKVAVWTMFLLQFFGEDGKMSFPQWRGHNSGWRGCTREGLPMLHVLLCRLVSLAVPLETFSAEQPATSKVQSAYALPQKHFRSHVGRYNPWGIGSCNNIVWIDICVVLEQFQLHFSSWRLFGSADYWVCRHHAGRHIPTEVSQPCERRPLSEYIDFSALKTYCRCLTIFVDDQTVGSRETVTFCKDTVKTPAVKHPYHHV